MREFYPYFLGFYILSFIIAYFSVTWSGFFYWPAFHGFAIFFSLIFISTLRFNLRASFVLSLKDRFSWPKFNLREKLHWPRFVLAIISSLILLASSLILLVGKYLLSIIDQINRQSRRYFILAYSKISGLSRPTRIKLISMAIILSLALFKRTSGVDFIVLSYALASIFFIFNSRIAAGMALISLIFCPILLLLKKDAWAEIVAIYAYYFLVITVLTQIREMKSNKNGSFRDF